MTNELSFDPQHEWYPVPQIPGAEWSIEVFTTSDARLLDPDKTQFDGRSLISDGLVWPGRQVTKPGTVRVAIDTDATFRITAGADLPIKAVKLLLRGLPNDESAGWWTPMTPRDTTLVPTPDDPVLLRYPWPNWHTPWVCQGEGPGVTLSVRDGDVRAKRFYAFRPPWSPTPVIEIVCDQLANRRADHFDVPPITVRACPDAAAIETSLNEHIRHLENAFGLIPWRERRDTPAWARDIRLALTLHGQHWTGYVFNTFDDMGQILDEVAKHIPGEQVLAYLPGWEGRYYWQYPVYQPGPDMGGPDGFRRLADTARRLGIRLMPMFGANGAHVERYPRWEQATFRSTSDRYVVHVNHPDWDGDRTREDEQVFLNPGEPEYRTFLRDQITRLVREYGVGGVFLDTSACWFDDPRHELFAGYQQLVNELRDDNPDLLIAGEGWYDALLGLFPMNQTWLDVTRPGRSTALPYRYSRILGHLNSGAPGHGSTGVHEGGYREVAKPLRIDGYIPALGLVDDTMADYPDDVIAFCRDVHADGKE